MDYHDPVQWKLAAEAVKAFTGAASEVVKMVKGFRAAPPTEPNQAAALEAAITEAERTAGVAEAQVLRALGYQLCHCTIPPTAMLTVGFQTRGTDTGKTVHECPKCNRNSAAPYGFQRTVPSTWVAPAS
jgi:hypothetical protein